MQKILRQIRQNNRGASLIELMAMLTVLALILSVMFATLMQSLHFARNTEARVQAVALAREWLEAVMNIRNTNWLRFPGDRTHCWRTQNYNAECFGNENVAQIDEGSYVLERRNGLWSLSGADAWSDWNASFWTYNLSVDSNWWYTANAEGARNCNINNKTSCRSIFAREITISDATNTGMTVTATVYWQHKTPKSVSLSTTLTNWKSHYDPGK